MTYCYKCKLCGQKWTQDLSVIVSYCHECEQFDCVVRDYKAEGVNVDTAVLREARG
jgi:phage terminase small subunit